MGDGQEDKASALATGLAALMPTMALASACLSFAVLLAQGETTRLLQATGWSGWLALLLTAGGAALGTGLLVAAARSVRVPTSVLVFVAALPWLAGVAGVSFGLHMVEEALMAATADMRPALLAAGAAEALTARIIGAWFASSLLGATGVGLAIAAAGQRAEQRMPAMALPGALLGLLACAAATFFVLGADVGLAPVAPVLLPGVGAMLGLAIAGAAIGEGDGGRSAALASGAGVALFGAFLAAAGAAETASFRQIIVSVSNADPATRQSLASEAAAVLVALRRTQMVGGGLLLVAAIGNAAWAAKKVRPTGGTIAGAVATVLALTLVVGADALVLSDVASSTESAVQPGWQDVAGFVPARFEGEAAGPADVVLTTTGLETQGGPPIAMATLNAGPSAAVGEALHRSADSLYPLPAPGEEGWSLALAADARVLGGTLRSVLSSARGAGADSVTFEGEGLVEETEEQRHAREAPLIGPLLRRSHGVVVRLERDTPRDDSTLTMRAPRTVSAHGHVGGAEPVALVAVPGQRSPFAAVPSRAEVLGRASDSRGYGSDPLVLLSFADDVTVATLLDAVDRARLGGMRVLLSTRPGPIAVGHQPVDDAPVGADPVDALLRGTSPANGGPNIRGSLDRDVIQGVFREATGRFRQCYERGLARSPTLAGRLVLDVTVGPDGRVQEAGLESTLPPGNPVDPCVQRVVEGLRFPPPRGGGIVVVRYPLIVNPQN